MNGGKSQRLRLSEVREVFRLVGECRELGVEASTWRGHLVTRLGDLVETQVRLACESSRPTAEATPGRVFQALDDGWPSARSRALWASHIGRGDYLRDPVIRKLQACAIRRGHCSRDQAIEDREWFGSPYYNETQRACEVDEFLLSFHDIPGGHRQSFLSMFRPRGGPPFRRRERRLVRLLHEEIGRHLGSALATLDDPSPTGLTPRLLDTLRCLLEGDSEKQVGARLGLTTSTVHEYVKALYKHFRVSSRPELLAHFLRRSRE